MKSVNNQEILIGDNSDDEKNGFWFNNSLVLLIKFYMVNLNFTIYNKINF